MRGYQKASQPKKNPPYQLQTDPNPLKSKAKAQAHLCEPTKERKKVKQEIKETKFQKIYN
jgi:hypothetical protein